MSKKKLVIDPESVKGKVGEWNQDTWTCKLCGCEENDGDRCFGTSYDADDDSAIDCDGISPQHFLDLQKAYTKATSKPFLSVEV